MEERPESSGTAEDNIQPNLEELLKVIKLLEKDLEGLKVELEKEVTRTRIIHWRQEALAALLAAGLLDGVLSLLSILLA